MSAFKSVSSSMISNVAGTFGIAAMDVAAFKPEVSAGLKAVRDMSFGHDAAPAFKPSEFHA